MRSRLPRVGICLEKPACNCRHVSCCGLLKGSPRCEPLPSASRALWPGGSAFATQGSERALAPVHLLGGALVMPRKIWSGPVIPPPKLAKMLPIGPGGLQSGFSILRYVRRDFRKKKSDPRTPRPPGGPPVMGSLVRRAEGLPSTRNWPFRWLPLPPTSPPQVIPKAM
jgi:hypothetical protein